MNVARPEESDGARGGKGRKERKRVREQAKLKDERERR